MALIQRQSGNSEYDGEKIYVIPKIHEIDAFNLQNIRKMYILDSLPSLIPLQQIYDQIKQYLCDVLDDKTGEKGPMPIVDTYTPQV